MHGYQFCTSLASQSHAGRRFCTSSALQFHAQPSVHDFRLTLNAVASGDLTLRFSRRPGHARPKMNPRTGRSAASALLDDPTGHKTKFAGNSDYGPIFVPFRALLVIFGFSCTAADLWVFMHGR